MQITFTARAPYVDVFEFISHHLLDYKKYCFIANLFKLFQIFFFFFKWNFREIGVTV